MRNDFSGFEVLYFPDELNLNKVYVVCIEGSGKRFPIYVGQTNRGYERLRDYLYPNFKASTDFKVGEALNYLTKKSAFKIFIYHKNTSTGKEEEKELIAKFKNRNYPLLNDLKGYDYRRADENYEKNKIHDFVDILISYHINMTEKR